MSTLEAWLRGRGAVPANQTPEHFGDPAAEYRSAVGSTVLFDASDRGILRLAGSDGLDLLHRTTTADLKGVAGGYVAKTIIQTETARILDWISLWVGVNEMTIVTAPGRAEEDRAWIDRMIIMDDAEIEDVSDQWTLMEILGPGAADCVSKALGVSVEERRHLTTTIDGHSLTLARESLGALPLYSLLAPKDFGGALAERLADAGATPAGAIVRDALRVERAVPAVGRELTEETNPLEAGLNDSIGFEKGCYTGQEVIARMITYKSIKRTLAGFHLAEDVPAPPEYRSWPVKDSGTAVGRLTSVARSFPGDRLVGLGILKNELNQAGQILTVETDRGSVKATVEALPFVS